MPKFETNVAAANQFIKVAAGQTTAQISNSGDSVPGRDYLERLIVTAASAATGTVILYDGTTVLLTQAVQPSAMTETNVNVYEMGIVAQTTKGFNVTTGSSISVAAIGRFF